MGRYLVELYLAGVAETCVAAGELDEEVRCLWSVFVPEDETCFLLCDAPTARAVRRAVERAGLESARIVKAVSGD